MKTSIKIAAAALVIASFGFEGCKKGANDPFMSIHTRKARVVGEWTMKSGSGTDVNGSASSWNYDGSNYTYTDQSGTSTAGMKWTMSFVKDGSYTTVQTMTSTGFSETITEKGTWNFTGKVGDDKNKDHIVMKTLSSVDVQTIGANSQTNTTTYTGDDAPANLYYLDELKNKEIIFTWDGTTLAGANASSSKGTMMLMQ